MADTRAVVSGIHYLNYIVSSPPAPKQKCLFVMPKWCIPNGHSWFFRLTAESQWNSFCNLPDSDILNPRKINNLPKVSKPPVWDHSSELLSDSCAKLRLWLNFLFAIASARAISKKKKSIKSLFWSGKHSKLKTTPLKWYFLIIC